MHMHYTIELINQIISPLHSMLYCRNAVEIERLYNAYYELIRRAQSQPGLPSI